MSADTPRICSVADCGKPLFARELCGMHYARARKAGMPLVYAPRPDECTVAECTNKVIAKGWCFMHYARMYDNGTLETVRKPTTELCSVDDCTRIVFSWGWCETHYRRWQDTGRLTTRRERTIEQRFFDKVTKTESCWIWTGRLNHHGYGHFHVRWTDDGKSIYTAAHRYAYELLVGPIPQGHTLDHLCHDRRTCQNGRECPHRRCVNPDHLEPVLPIENTARSGGIGVLNSEKTHCKRGHPFDEVNTYWIRNRDGSIRGRSCLTCNRLQKRAMREAGKRDRKRPQQE